MLTPSRCPFHPRVTAVASKKKTTTTGHSAKVQVVGYTWTRIHPWSQQSRSGLTMPLCRHSVGISGNKLTRNSSRNTRPLSPQFGEPLWTDPDLSSRTGVRDLISTYKKKKKSTGGEWIFEHSPKILAREEKATIKYNYYDCQLMYSIDETNNTKWNKFARTWRQDKWMGGEPRFFIRFRGMLFLRREALALRHGKHEKKTAFLKKKFIQLFIKSLF